MFYYDTVLIKQPNLEKGSRDLILLGVFQGVRFHYRFLLLGQIPDTPPRRPIYVIACTYNVTYTLGQTARIS